MRLNKPLYFVLLLVSGVYLWTMSPFIQGGDSGELVLTAWKLATPHPPGYPTYTFLAHVFTYLPFQSLAWRVALFSSVCQLGALILMYRLLRRWLGESPFNSVIVLFFALAPLSWRYAIEPEVFALNNFFAAAMLNVFFEYHSSRDRKWAYVATFLLGLACTHHLTILFLAFPFFVYFLWSERRSLIRVRVLAISFGLFVLGLTPYLLLFYLGHHDSLFSWGDTTTWRGFWVHVTRAEYGSFQLATGGKENAGFWLKFYYFLREMGDQVFWLGLVPIGLAIYNLKQVREPKALFARLILCTFVFYGVLFHLLSNLDLRIPLYHHAQARMWIMPLLLFVLLFGYGLRLLAAKVSRTQQRGVLIGAIALCAANVIFNWRVVDGSKRDFFERVGHTMIDNVERNAVILMREDAYVNSIRYLQAAKGIRPDVTMLPIDCFGWPWFRERVLKHVPGFSVPLGVLRTDPKGVAGFFGVKDLLDLNIDKFPIYVSKLNASEEKYLRGSYVGFPFGFHSIVKREGYEFELPQVLHESRLFLDFTVPAVKDYPWDSWETYIIQNYFSVKVAMGQILVRRSKLRIDWLNEAIQIFKGVIAGSEEFRAVAWGSLGETYGLFAAQFVQYRALAIQAWEEYMKLNPPEDEYKQKIRKLLGEYKSQK